jgi:hypothetical protein
MGLVKKRVRGGSSLTNLGATQLREVAGGREGIEIEVE